MVKGSIIPANVSKTQSFKLNSSNLSSVLSSSVSSLSNRTNSYDYEFDPEADADTDFSNEFSNFSIKKSSEKTNIHQLFLSVSKPNAERRVSSDSSHKSSPSTSISYSTKIKSNSMLSIDHGKNISQIILN